MCKKLLTIIASAALLAIMLMPEPAEARIGGFRGGFGGFRGAAIGGWRGGGWGFRGAGWRGAGWRGGGWGWRRGWGWGLGAAAVGAGLVAASSYPYYGYGYGYGYPADYYGYGGCVLQRRLVLTSWGYQPTLVRVCY